MTTTFPLPVGKRPLPRPGLLLAVLVPLLLLVCLDAGQAVAASEREGYNQARQHFQAVAENRKKAALRVHWERVEQEFSALYKANPKGPYAAKSLFYLGRVHESLGKASGMKADLLKAEEYYSKSVNEFPDQRDMDDILYRRGRIRLKLDLPEQAATDFRALVKAHKHSSLAPKAREELRGMGASLQEPQPQTESRGKKDKGAKSGTDTSASPTPPQSKVPAMLGSINYASGKEYTRVTLALDGEVTCREKSLPQGSKQPRHLSLTLQGATLSSKVPSKITVADGHLNKIRSGQNSPDTVQVLFDLKDRQEFKVTRLTNPFRVLVDVYAPGAAPAEGVAEEAETSPPPATGKGKKPPRYVPPEGSRKMAADLVEQLGLTVRRIMIDPGHGGNDPGAQANGLVEKDLNLKFARILGGLLERRGLSVHYTRTSDKYIPLEERTSQANANKADMFISIHCNANKNPGISGIETYSLNLASSKHAVSVAARENAQEPKNISDLQVILTDLMLSSKLKESRDAAGSIQAKAVYTVGPTFPILDHGVREAPFYVLMGAKMPSVLVELGYLTNRAEARRLGSDKYLNLLAKGIVTGVLAYKTQIEHVATR